MEISLNVIIFILSFVVIALASKEIGQYFSKIKLPLISGFLIAGVVAGPFVLGLIPLEAIEHLRFVDEISLAVIAFAAGSELYLPELRHRFKSIAWVTTGLVIATFTLGSLAFFILADSLPFMQAIPPAGRVAIAIIAGAILVAQSPSSAIAIVNELRAKGPFTQTALGVTVVMDIVVITLFAVNTTLADALLTNLGFDLSFVILLVAELLVSLLLGYILGKFLEFILARRLKSIVKAGLILLAGYGIFVLSAAVRDVSHARLPVEIFLEPLLICMCGSFVLTNFSNYRTEFLKILHDVAPPIYVAFFTLTGASLALDILLETWQIALILFVVRLIGRFIGSFAGGALAGDPMKHNRVSWMTYVTQAGVGLGLAKEVAVEFPEFGTAFATVMISTIVLSQLIGPPFFKWAINHVDEAHTRADTPEFDGVRDAIIFGLDGPALALARQLRTHGWQVKLASMHRNTNGGVSEANLDIHPISDLSLETLHQLNAGQAEAIITMLSDNENYRVCELAYEHFGTENLVVRLNDRGNFDRFHELGALIVDPATAIVSLLDHLVRSPSAASLLLGTDENQDIIDIEVRDPDLHGVAIRDLHLPLDTIILSIHRDGHLLVSHGFTRLRMGDYVTVVGSFKSLDELMLRFEE